MGERVTSDRIARIAEANDAFRRTGNFVATQGAMALPGFDGLVQAVREYDNFGVEGDDDPWGEHDFGVIYWANTKMFWKIDYMDQDTGYWRDPLDPECDRVLTVMCGHEY